MLLFLKLEKIWKNNEKSRVEGVAKTILRYMYSYINKNSSLSFQKI